MGINKSKTWPKEKIIDMSEVTISIKEATEGPQIQEIESILNQFDGVDRVLIDTEDGDIKIEFDNKIISKERIAITLQQYDFHTM